MPTYRENIEALARESAIRELTRMEVGETLQISSIELKLYQWARDQLGDRRFEGERFKDEYRAWYVITRVS